MGSSNLQLLRKVRKHFLTGLRHHHHVLDTDAPETGIIKARLNRDDLALLENDFLQPRIFVNIQSETVAGAMEKSDAPSFFDTRFVAAFGKQVLDGAMNRHSVHAGLYPSQGQLLP